MKIKIPYSTQNIDKKDIKSVNSVLKSNWLTQGPKILEFEKSICNYTGAKYAVAVSSCTAGLHLSCIVAGINKSNKIITSPITFVSSANAAIFCNSKVVLSDINSNKACLSIEELKKNIKKFKNIKAVMPVHYAGSAEGMEDIYKICKKNKIFVIEDCAHSLGSNYKSGERVGSCKYSDISVFSLHPVKTITAGEGGVITTNNRLIYERLLRLRSHGINKNSKFINNQNAFTGSIKNPWYYEMQELGYHYRITDIQCALANSQLKKIDKFVNKRKKLAKKYNIEFKKAKNFKVLNTNGSNLSSNHLYVIKIDFSKLKITKAELINKLANNQIGSQVHYLPLHFHPFLSNKIINKRNCKNSERFYKAALSIPLYFNLTYNEQLYVIKKIRELVG